MSRPEDDFLRDKMLCGPAPHPAPQQKGGPGGTGRRNHPGSNETRRGSELRLSRSAHIRSWLGRSLSPEARWADPPPHRFLSTPLGFDGKGGNVPEGGETMDSRPVSDCALPLPLSLCILSHYPPGLFRRGRGAFEERPGWERATAICQNISGHF